MMSKLIKGTLLVFVVFLGIWILAVWFQPQQKFTPEAWAKTPWQQRYKFVDSLMDDYELEGLTREEVRVLLGEPDSDGRGAFEYKVVPDLIFDWRVFYLTYEENKVVGYGVSVPDW